MGVLLLILRGSRAFHEKCETLFVQKADNIRRNAEFSIAVPGRQAVASLSVGRMTCCIAELPSGSQKTPYIVGKPFAFSAGAGALWTTMAQQQMRLCQEAL
tara:strand:- start:18767 stop:19069 length:303 start_codon:yes stop_codon:yes gene_type:complete